MNRANTGILRLFFSFYFLRSLHLTFYMPVQAGREVEGMAEVAAVLVAGMAVDSAAGTMAVVVELDP